MIIYISTKVNTYSTNKTFPYFPYNYLIRAKIRENTYHFTNEQAGMPVKLGKLARYFGKFEVVEEKHYEKNYVW